MTVNGVDPRLVPETSSVYSDRHAIKIPFTLHATMSAVDSSATVTSHSARLYPHHSLLLQF